MLQLLDFYADWCGPCKIMAPVFTEIEPEYKGKVEFKKVDVEAQTQLAGSFSVMSIPTFILMKDGKEVDRKIGAMPKDVLKGWLNSHLS